jgi:hypothetical protein
MLAIFPQTILFERPETKNELLMVTKNSWFFQIFLATTNPCGLRFQLLTQSFHLRLNFFAKIKIDLLSDFLNELLRFTEI